MNNQTMEWLLREIARVQEAEEEYLFDRIAQLEQLCLDMYKVYCQGLDWTRFNDRFVSLGLIEGKTIAEHRKDMGLD